MKLVIPVRAARHNEPLRWALRAWSKQVPWAEPVVVGTAPAWYSGETVVTAQKYAPTHQWTYNLSTALQAAANACDEPFWWTADDIFPMSPQDEMSTYDPPTWCRLDDLDQYPSDWDQATSAGQHLNFLAGMAYQRDIMIELGLPGIDNADMHMPHLLDPDNVRTLLDLLTARFPRHPRGHFRAIYGEMFPGRVVRIVDPKVGPRAASPKSRLWISTSTPSWAGTAGHLVRRAYPKPSPWER